MGASTRLPLERLSWQAGVEFDNLFRARELTCKGLKEYRSRLADVGAPEDIAVVLMGSWGRAEVTSGSDNDFVILDNTNPTRDLEPFQKRVEMVLNQSPSADGPFASPVRCDPLVDQIGLQEDSNHHLTRRMLYLLESVPVLGDELYHSLFDRLLERYLDVSVKDKRPPRFLLNDIVRYWRTICVDFAGKERRNGEKWGLRNAKLRTSRKLLFAAGLLPVLRCSTFEKEEMFTFLREQLSMPPADRIADAFLSYEMFDPGARTLRAYDEFIGLIDRNDFRDALAGLRREDKDDSEEFRRVRRIGSELQVGLLALLFESTGDLPELVRDYVVF